MDLVERRQEKALAGLALCAALVMGLVLLTLGLTLLDTPVAGTIAASRPFVIVRHAANPSLARLAGYAGNH